MIDQKLKEEALALFKKPYEKMTCKELNTVRYYLKSLIQESTASGRDQSEFTIYRTKMIEKIEAMMKRKKCKEMKK